MATPTAITVTLDREREIRWGPRAEVRLDSLPRSPARPGIYQTCAILWAMLVDDSGFPAPEDLGEYLNTREKFKAVSSAMFAAKEQAADDEKNARGSKQKPAPASS